MSIGLFLAISLCFLVLVVYLLCTTDTALRERAKHMTRAELEDEIMWAHAMGGEWEVYFEELESRGEED